MIVQKRENRGQIPKIQRFKGDEELAIEKNNAKEEKKKMPVDRGNYICEKVVGKGVFGTVFKVRFISIHVCLNRRNAWKQMKPLLLKKS